MGSQPKAPRRADGSMLNPSGAIVVYCQALMDGAAKKEESVSVTKDVMKLKDAFKDEEFLDKLHASINIPYLTPLEKVAIIEESCGKMESTVLPAFLKFLAKKQRLQSLNKILKEYVQRIYFDQKITPVRCISADPLSDDQKTAIIAKMKERLGVADIKLLCVTDRSLLGGFKLEYGFTDPDTCNICSDGEDLSLRGFLEKSAVSEGVIVGDF